MEEYLRSVQSRSWEALDEPIAIGISAIADIPIKNWFAAVTVPIDLLII